MVYRFVKQPCDNSPPLLRTPRIKPGEGIAGYILRLTEANGYTTPNRIVGIADLQAPFTKGGQTILRLCGKDLTRLEYLARLELGSLGRANCGYRFLEREAVRGSEMLLDFWGQGVPIRAIRFSTTKICPACLREDNFCRSIWDLLPVMACPAHGVILEDVCVRCGKCITWARSRVSTCECGFDWRNTSPSPAHPGAVEVARHVYRLCGFLYGEEADARQGAGPLHTSNLAQYCQALFLVADHYLFETAGTRLKDAGGNRMGHESYARAYEAFERWPQSFNDFLDEYGFRMEAGQSAVEPLLSLHHQAVISAPDFLVAILEDYCQAVSTEAVRQGTLLHLLDRKLVRKGEVCSYYKLKEEVLEACIRAGQVTVVGEDAHGEALLDNRSVSALVRILRGYPLSFDVADRLCVCVSDVEDLVRHDCLRPLMGALPPDRERWRFAPDEADHLFGEVTRRLQRIDQCASHKLVSLNYVLNLIGKYRYGLGRLVRDILDGKLAPVTKRRLPGLNGFTFLKAEVYEYFKNLCGAEDVEKSPPPNYKLRAHILETWRDRTLKEHPRRTIRATQAEYISLEVSDLARIAWDVFTRTPS